MPRGAYKFKGAKTAQVDASAPLCVPGIPSMSTKPTRPKTDWRRPSLPTPSFLSRNTSQTNLASPVPNQLPPVRESSCQQDGPADSLPRKPDLPLESAQASKDLECDEEGDAASSSLPNELERPARPTFSRLSSAQSSEEEDTFKAVFDTFEDLTIEGTQSSASSLYSSTSSLYSKDSASIYSSASSIYSSGASIYSFDDCESREADRYIRTGSTEQIAEEDEGTLDSDVPGAPQYQQRARPVPVRRQEPQDAASRERSSLAKKAALFKNCRLPPQLPLFHTSLPTWSMVCRAAQASQDCYDSRILTRRGTYTPADTSKDIKAMIIDDQLVDNSRLVIVSFRGTEFKSLADWAANKASNPAQPVGFLDDEENACHAGFLQVAKAMVGQVAAQLQQHPASSQSPSLLFTGHSAGGAVAAMLYSHMLSTVVESELTALASLFPSINCVTFGAPPLSLTPLPRRGPGIFLSFANEGDPILRLSNAAYVKSLAKLMTASLPTAPPVKVVRRSRGTQVIRKTILAGPATPWEELPMWPTPPPPMTNAGDVILLRNNEHGRALASKVTDEDLRDVFFADLAQHPVQMYIRRVKELALAAMMGRDI